MKPQLSVVTSLILTAILLPLSAKADETGGTIYLGSADSPETNHFNNALKAFDAINSLADKGVKSIRLEVSPGVYWIDDPDDDTIKKMPDNSIPYGVTLRCDTLYITGSDENPVNTVFAANRGQTRGALGNYTMFHFIGSSLCLENITFGNYCNVDLVFPLNPALNRPKRSDAIVQAQIGICEGTGRLYASNCRFISRLNLCPFVGAHRSLYKSCYFECTDDALSGSAVYLDCGFTFFSSKPFYSTSHTGAVFLNCDITLRGKGPQFLTKVPGMVTMIDTRFHTGDSNRDMTIRWSNDHSSSVSYYSDILLDGKRYDIDSDRPAMSVNLSGKRALDAYKFTLNGETIYNTPNLLAGDDNWDPLGIRPKVVEAQENLKRPLLDLPVRLDIADRKITLSAPGNSTILRPVLLRWGGYILGNAAVKRLFPMAINYDASSLIGMKSLQGWGEVEISDKSYMPKEIEGYILATTDYGLCGIAPYSLAPYLKEAPAFRVSPAIKQKKGTITLDYVLENDANDASHIEWYSCSDSNWNDSIPLRHGAGKQFASFSPGSSDTGRYIGVVIIPRNTDSKPGEAVRLISDRPIRKSDVNAAKKRSESRYFTDFSEVPVRLQPKLSPGAWTFDAYKPTDTAPYDWTPDPEHAWYYGRGTDGAKGIGLVQWTRGARAFFTPPMVSSRNMEVKIELEPCKSAGQGFGSATGQYLDIYIKYNPETQCGYGLRIERTPDYDHAVVFTLMRFIGGKAEPLSPTVASSCFRSPCLVDLSLRDGVLSAHCESRNATDMQQTQNGVLSEVNLSAEIDDTVSPASFGLQHTGTTGGSATLISKLELNWE